MAENMEYKLFLFKMPRKTTSSVTYKLKVPNLFTLPEYDGTSLEINSPCFEFADATWCFRCKPEENTYADDWIKYFDIYLVRLNFKRRVQTIFSSLILLDADDKEYNYHSDGSVFKEIDEEENCLASLDNKESSYDRRDTLTFIIHLFVSAEMDVQINKKVSNSDEQDATGTLEHTEMYADLLSVTTDRGIISLKQQFKDMLQNGQDYNAIFNVGDKQFRAHQDILRVRSEVFRSILNHDMLQKNSDVINVPDCDPEVFQQILTYIYTGQVDTIHSNNMFDLHYAADKYRLVDLKAECRKFIMKSITVTNVCKALELAMKHFDASFLDYVSNYFINNRDDILPTVEWQLFMKEHSTASNELLIKSRKKGVPQSTTEKLKDCEISLTELPSGLVSSTSYTLTVPNFFTRPEYDGVSFKLISLFFKFANATWHFGCDSIDRHADVAGIKVFLVRMIRLSSELPEQIIFYRFAILDADDEEYISHVDTNVYTKDAEDLFMIIISNKNPTYDRRDNLTLIIHLFYIEPVEVDAEQMTLATVRGFKSLSEDFKNVLLNGQDHNLILNVRDMKFQAHRDILRARSEVFRSMLSHNMQEKKSGVIDVHDCDPEAFKQLLYYIYTENVELDEDNMFNLYYAADKYNFTYLKEACSDVILKSLSVNNVCDALELATKHSDNDILYSATSYFLSNMDDILLTERWLLFLKEYPSVANELKLKSRVILKNTKS